MKNKALLMMTGKQKRVLIALGMVLIVSGGFVWDHLAGPYHLRTVTEGKLYRSGSMSSENFEKTVKQYGIKTVVALNLEFEDDPQPDWYDYENAICKQQGINFVHTPMLAYSAPSDKNLRDWLAIMDDDANYPILVHCAQGVIRTGIFVAVYQEEYLHKDNRKTLSELPFLDGVLDEPRQKDIRDFILTYKPRWKK